jgi:hypothetical protein
MRRQCSAVVVSVFAIAVGFAGCVTPTRAQSKPVSIRRRGKWETLAAGGGGGRGGGGGGGLPPDGQWLARDQQIEPRQRAALRTSDEGGTTEVRIRSRLLGRHEGARAIGYSEAEQERMRTQQRLHQNHLAIMNLALARSRWSTRFNPLRSAATAVPPHATARRRPRAGASSRAAPAAGGRGRNWDCRPVADDPDPTGVAVRNRNLASGAEMSFAMSAGGVAGHGRSLALTISATERAERSPPLRRRAARFASRFRPSTVSAPMAKRCPDPS